MTKKTTWIQSGVVSVPARRNTPRTGDGKRHPVTVRYVDPRPAASADRVRANTWRNDGYTAHSDTRAKLYK